MSTICIEGPFKPGQFDHLSDTFGQKPGIGGASHPHIMWAELLGTAAWRGSESKSQVTVPMTQTPITPQHSGLTTGETPMGALLYKSGPGGGTVGDHGIKIWENYTQDLSGLASLAEKRQNIQQLEYHRVGHSRAFRAQRKHVSLLSVTPFFAR